MSIFGTFTSRGEVLNAVLGTLRLWTVTYLAEVERQEGLRPRSITPPGSSLPNTAGQYPLDSRAFRSGLDFETFQGEQLPLVIVVCEPAGDAERYATGRFAQWYEVQIGAVVQDLEQETVAQQSADRYGKALMGLVSQQGGFGTRVDPETGETVPFAEKTLLVSAPRTEFVDPGARQYARSTVTAHTLVELVTDEQHGPRVPPANPYDDPQDWPSASTVEFELQTESTTGAIGPATGATVTLPYKGGQVIVTE